MTSALGLEFRAARPVRLAPPLDEAAMLPAGWRSSADEEQAAGHLRALG